MTRGWPSSKRLAQSSRVLLLLASLVTLYPLQRHIDALREGAGANKPEMLLLPTGERLRRWCDGYSGLLATVFWTRAVQYYGRHRLAQAMDFPYLGALLNLTTDLDPHLLIAYRFGSLFLAGKPPEGAGHPEQAIYLLNRGIVANPNYWRFWEDLGFIYYWDLKDYAHAAQAFRIGSERPGAYPWMRALAAAVAAKGGEIRTSRILWLEIARSAGNDTMRQSAVAHLAALDAQDALNRLNGVLDRYQQRTGRPARSFAEVMAAGYLPGISLDPTGEPYSVGPDGRAKLGPGSKIDLRLLQ